MSQHSLPPVPLVGNLTDPGTPPPLGSGLKPLFSSTPTESLRSSITAKRISILSVEPDFGLGPDYDSPEGWGRGRDSRIEKWLEQQCGGRFTWENTDEALVAKQRSDEDLQLSLRHRRTLAVTSLTTTRSTSATSSFDSDPLLPLSSPTTAASSWPQGPPSASSTQSKFRMLPSTLARAQEDEAEGDGIRADSPLLGLTAGAVAAAAPIGTISDVEETESTVHTLVKVGGLPSVGVTPDVDKPLPNPPIPPSLPKTTTATSVNADDASQTMASGPASHPQSLPSRTSSRFGIKHSPTPSNASSSSSHHSSSQNSHRHLRSQSNSHSTAAHLPIGVVQPSSVPHSHSHNRSLSGKSTSSHVLAPCSNVAPSASGALGTHVNSHHISRHMSRTISIIPGVNLSLTTPAPSMKTEVSTASARRPSLLQQMPIVEVGVTQVIHTHTREASMDSSESTGPKAVSAPATSVSMPLAGYVVHTSSTSRNRSYSIPKSTSMQFHLPTGMLHRSQSHAQLRIGGALPPFSLQDSPILASQRSDNLPLAASHSPTSVVPRHTRKSSRPTRSPKATSPAVSSTHSHSSSHASTTSAVFSELQEELEDDPSMQNKIRKTPTRTYSLANLQNHNRQQSQQILDTLESRVPSLSFASSRTAVYLDSEDVNTKLIEWLLTANDETESRALEEEEEEEEGLEENGESSGTCEAEGTIEGGDRTNAEDWADRMLSSARGEGSVCEQLDSPPNTPATSHFESHGSNSATGSVPEVTNGTNITESSASDLYASPEASSSQVYLGNDHASPMISKERSDDTDLEIAEVTRKPPVPLRPPPAPPLDITGVDLAIAKTETVMDLPPPVVEIIETSSQEGEVAPSKDVYSPIEHPESDDEDAELMDEALAFARELAVGDRIVWGGRRSLEIYGDDWSDFEDEELGVGILGANGLPRVTSGPYGAYHTGEGSVRGVKVTEDGQAHVQFLFGDEDGHEGVDGGLAPPSMSKWSLTSSIDDEKRLSDENKKKKKRRSFVPFVISVDKEKDDASSYKDVGSVSKKRNRLASFISRLSSVGLGSGSGSNTPSSRIPPVPVPSASSSSHTLPSLVPSPIIPSPSIPTLVTAFVGGRSRSPSPQFEPHPHPTVAPDLGAGQNSHLAPPILGAGSSVLQPPRPILKSVSSSASIRVPPSIIIPPLPTYPPPVNVNTHSVPRSLGKAASEGMANLRPAPPMIRARANSAADDVAKKLAFLNPTLPAKNYSQPLAPSSIRRPALTKSASASVLGLNQMLISPFAGADMASAYVYPDVPPTPSSIASTEEYGDVQIREYDGQRSSRLKGMLSSVDLLSSSGVVSPAPSRSKGGLKAMVGRWTGRGKNTARTTNVEQSSPTTVLQGALFGRNPQRPSSEDDTDPSTPVAEDTCRTPMPTHSPTGLVSSASSAILVGMQ